MKKIITILSLVLSSTTFANNSISHSSCELVIGSEGTDRYEAILMSKGYQLLLKDYADDGELVINGNTSCFDRLGMFKWQVCKSEFKINEKKNNGVVRRAVVSEKVEFNFELTNKYPRYESRIKAIEALPSCTLNH